MDFLNVQPVINEPALFIQNKKILVIADLHIGIENELKNQGVNTESKTELMLNNLMRLCEHYKPFDLIILGDVKHNIPSSTTWERKDVEKFLNTIKQHATIHIIPGNHDGNIKKIIPSEIIVHPSDGYVIEDIGFFHGHRWPSKKVMICEMIIMAHTHPTVMLTDRRGFSTYESCWLKTNFNKNKLKEKYPDSADIQILIMPAFNPLCGGVAVNKQGVTGPVGKILNLPESQIYLIDGSSLGQLKNIK